MNKKLKAKAKKLDKVMKDFTAGLPEPRKIAFQDLAMATNQLRIIAVMVDSYHSERMNYAEFDAFLDDLLQKPTGTVIEKLCELYCAHTPGGN